MDNKNRDYFPGAWSDEEPQSSWDAEEEAVVKSGSRLSAAFWLSLVGFVTVFAILLTYTLTSAAKRKEYSEKLAAQQALLDAYANANYYGEYEKLALLDALFQNYGYYAGKTSKEELMDAILKAYAQATGDLYAEYYTEEEYAALMSDAEGNSVGIGVYVAQTTCQVNGLQYMVYEVLTVYANSSAAETDLRAGDLIYGVEMDGVVKTVNELGYTGMLNAIKGEAGTKVRIAVLRPEGSESYATMIYEIERRSFEKQSVSGKISATDPTVGIVSIVEFDLVAPKQLKETVLALKAQGIEKFVFDLRNNPGGDLLSIKAILSYFLQEGDVVLQSIDRNNNVRDTYRVEVSAYQGRYADCSVKKSDIGIFADLDMVVLCNKNTASAAEVFTASLRDYELATVVGETTFGKGIMQTYVGLSAYGDYDGYFKMTTYAYVTKCGVTYHEIGITPHVQVSQSEEALQYNPYLLPEQLDDQLQAAIGQFQN
ncbi:MAG: hypothetical protein IKZ16_05580 [Clostridia bacterium]|nr:hypothetical protein [Clostridia bacterium]